jgi:predicted transcriptional regulator
LFILYLIRLQIGPYFGLARYRSRYDIIADVLTMCVGEGSSLTKLYYSASVSYKRLKQLLENMVQSGLLMVIDNKYQCTSKGTRFLALHSEIGMLLGDKKSKDETDDALLNRAREYSLKIKEFDRSTGSLLLQGRGRAVLDAVAYYILANSEGRRVTLNDASRVFGVSINSISRTKKLIESELLQNEGSTKG